MRHYWTRKKFSQALGMLWLNSWSWKPRYSFRQIYSSWARMVLLPELFLKRKYVSFFPKKIASYLVSMVAVCFKFDTEAEIQYTHTHIPILACSGK